MTVTLAFTEVGTLCRVDIDATGLAAADVALVERSTDQVRWTTVRGASAWPCSGGSFVRTLHDYEFTAGVPNFYRVRGVETGAITFVGSNSTVTDANAAGNATVAPTIFATATEHDAMILWTAIRNSGTGTPNTTALQAQGWEPILVFGNVGLFGRYFVPGDTGVTCSFTGGVANATINGKILVFRRMSLAPLVTNTQLNGASSTTVAFPVLNVTEDGCAVLAGLWRQDDATSIGAVKVGYTIDQDSVTTLGDDMETAFNHLIETTATGLVAGTAAVVGGSSAISRAIVGAFPHADYLNSQTEDITPVLTSHWLKSIARPQLNMPVRVGPRRDRRYAARQTLLDIVDRTDPLAITSRRASATFDLPVRTRSVAEEQQLRNLLAGGDIMLLHAPAGSRYTTTYVTVGDVGEGILGQAAIEHWMLPCTTAAAPEADVVGATTTCDTILSDFATCADVMAEFATCVEVMEYISDPSDVIVP